MASNALGKDAAKVWSHSYVYSSSYVSRLNWFGILQSTRTIHACRRQFAASLARNKQLVHINLSDNAFGLEVGVTAPRASVRRMGLVCLVTRAALTSCQAVQVLAEQIKSNHTILGLHFDGANNRGYIDPDGFLVPLACKDKRPKTIAPRCWICGGWREHKFYFREYGSLREIARPEDEDAVPTRHRSRMLLSTTQP